MTACIPAGRGECRHEASSTQGGGTLGSLALILSPASRHVVTSGTLPWLAAIQSSRGRRPAKSISGPPAAACDDAHTAPGCVLRERAPQRATGGGRGGCERGAAAAAARRRAAACTAAAAAAAQQHTVDTAQPAAAVWPAAAVCCVAAVCTSTGTTLVESSTGIQFPLVPAGTAVQL